MSTCCNRIKAAIQLPLCIIPFFLTGCAGIAGISLPTGASPDPTGNVQILSGTSHGGIYPMANAEIYVYMAGVDGYATTNSNSATLNYIAATQANSNGIFSFGLDLASPNDGTTSTFHCPTDGTDPQLYLVSSGGDSSNSGQTGISNSVAVMVAAIGSCSGAYGHAYITINEATTVATVWAMQQFMNVTSTDVMIGSPSTKTAGLAAAYNTVQLLVNPITGIPNTTHSVANSGTGVTIVATPESAKVIALANLLANCVNQTNPSATPCSTLLTNSVSPSFQTSSQPVVSPAQGAVNTAQAAFYLAINPSQGQDSGSGGATVIAGNSRMTALYNATYGYSPFGPSGLSTQPVSWTVTIAYSAGSSTCTSANSAQPFASPAQIAIDGQGDVWVTNNAGTNNAVLEMSSVGQSLGCWDGTFAQGNAIAIDAKNNIWYTAGSGGTSAGLFEIRGGAGLPISWTLPSSSSTFEPYSLTIDKAGDLIMMSNGSGTYSFVPYIYTGASLARSTFAPTAMSGTNDTEKPYAIALSYTTDDSHYYLGTVGGSNFYDYEPATSGTFPLGAPLTIENGTAAAAQYSAGSRVAGDTLKRFAGASAYGTSVPYSTWFYWDPNAGNYAGAVNSTAYLGGLGSATGFAVDGLGHYWSGSYGVVAANTLAFFEVKNDVATALSPTGSSPGTCSGTSCLTGGGFQFPQGHSGNEMYDIAIDISGNVWGSVTGGSSASNNGLIELVGAAVPVVTPLPANLP